MKYKMGKLAGKDGILRIAPELCGYKRGEKLEIHVANTANVILPQKMTAMDMVYAIESLAEMTVGLMMKLHMICGECEEDRCKIVDGIADDIMELMDVDERVVNMLIASGIAMCELRRRIENEDVVYEADELENGGMRM